MITTLSNEHLTIAVDTAGAELSSVFHKKRKQEYLWQGSKEWWPRRAPVLFPIVGKVLNNAYRVEGKSYSLPQHGFARDCEFELLEQTGSTLSYLLKSSEELLKKYPFDFELIIAYRLDGNSLHVDYTVTNPGKTELCFSVGAHPGFAFQKGETLSDYSIQFDQPENINRYLIEDGFLTGATEKILDHSSLLHLTDELMKKDAIVLKGMKSTRLELKSNTSDYRLEFNAVGFPFFGIWSKPGAPFVCLEPWFGIADTVGFAGEYREKEGIQFLAPANVFACSFSVTIPG